MAKTRTPSRKTPHENTRPSIFQQPIHPGSAISAGDFSVSVVRNILESADTLEQQDPFRRADRLAKRRVALLFYESSTRTRTSFELAAKSLGADTTLVSSLSSSIEKGESLKDTGITLQALGAECIILRSPYSGAPYLLAQATGLPVINAGDGMAEHPSQALLDLRTILQFLQIPSRKISEKILRGVTLTICGDILHSRVARSNALLLPKLGAKVILCGPPALLPDSATAMGPRLALSRDFDAALRQSQIVMMLRIQAERLSGLQINLDDYRSRYQANADRMAQHAPKVLIMHPGPIIRGMEITAEVADGPNSAIARQVHNGVAIRMALLVRALAGAKKGSRR
ncbi:MAG TPA: aspartate carbamoyltransferase catalytic subunit [Acidobacteriaceae bacterium]|jgi:aspartate carbamoyltransferase catalytic subunit|nr:aspartate carbamoyltransferase catalytic subunit [Acidobacteriaceae bacterium]